MALHGNENAECMSNELFILNCADMSTGPNGEDFTFDKRLAEIANRFGHKTSPYNKCLTEIEKLKTDKRYHKIY